MKHRLNMFVPHLLMRPAACRHSLGVFFITIIASLNSFSSCPLHHRQSLLRFKSMISAYYADDTSSFTGLSSWNSSSIDCCTWERVNCSLQSPLKPVTELHLSSVIIRGRTFISSEVLLPLFNINSLLFLDVSGNFLQGRIPGDELSNLTSLAYLDMSANHGINGSIPSQIFGMKNLYHLGLGYNSITGNLSENIGNLSKLTHLNLGSNSLTGNLIEIIGNLSKLAYLDLGFNLLTGNLSGNQGRPWICDLELSAVFLSNNNLTGSLPSCLFESKTIKTIMLRNNNFSGELPISISNNFKLVYLDLSNNALLGEIFSKFGTKNNMGFVNLSFNYFSNKLPLSFGRGIEMLILNNNDFSGKLFMNFSSMPSLVMIDLHDNRITGEIPYSLGSLTFLRILNLRNNQIYGSIPDSLTNLTLLRIIDLSSNKINGIIPPYFPNISVLINNVFPIIIFEARNDVIFNWKGFLQVMETDKSMEHPTLDLSNNELTGEIPEHIGQLKVLKSLNLSYNNINGVIPTSVGQLEGLESLDLSHNNLSGKIPNSFGKLHDLTKLDLSNNMLAGKIPEGGQMSTMDDLSIYANNSGFCGFQINVSCVSEPASPKVLPGHVDDEERKVGMQFIWEALCLGYVFGLAWAIWLTYFCGIIGPNLIRGLFYHRSNQHNNL